MSKSKKHQINKNIIRVEYEEINGVPVRAYTKKDMCKILSPSYQDIDTDMTAVTPISSSTLKKQLTPLFKKMGLNTGSYNHIRSFTRYQVRIILTHLL